MVGSSRGVTVSSEDDSDAREQLKRDFFAGKLSTDSKVTHGGAYLRWFLGGWAAWHHIYLDRSFTALLYLCSPGLLCIGLLRDLYRIPQYVDACNDTAQNRDQLNIDQKYNKQPPWSFSRLIAMYLCATWFAVVGSLIGPYGFFQQWFSVTSALGAGLGVWLAGCACTNQTGPPLWKICLVSCGGLLISPGIGIIFAMIYFGWNRQWKRESEKPRLSWWKMIGLVWLFWAICFFGAMEHCTFSSNGRQINLKQGIYNAYKSGFIENLYLGFKDVNWDKINDSNYWEDYMEGFRKRMDVSGEKRALRTLGMEDFIGKDYTADDVKKAYRATAKKWHPDRLPPDEKESAEAKMQEVNEAKAILDGLQK